MDKKNAQRLWTYDEALSFLYKAIDYEKLIGYQYNASTFSLDRMVKMLEYAGNPHKAFPSIHITGTKGKGSTAIMMSTILEHAGIKTGLFTSPHLIDLRERIQINHQNIAELDFAGVLNEFLPYIQRLRDTDLSVSPTFFETLTAVCLLYFKRNLVEMSVLEVGLGGRLDSTNVVTPQVSIITNVGLDHTTILGNTLSSIAYEKAGIVKRGVAVVSAVESPEALSVIEKTCKEKMSKLYLLGRNIWVEEVKGIRKNRTHGALCKIKTWRHTYNNIFLPLVGAHQTKNCALVLGALDILREQGDIAIDDETIRHAFANVYCPARIEVVGENPLIILDCAHTADSMKFLRESLLANFTFNKLVLVLGFSQDKDLDNILKEIVAVGNSIVVTKSKNPRAALPEDLCRKVKTLCGKQPEIFDNIPAAIIAAKSIANKADLICITGSVYVAGEAMKILKANPAS